MSDSSLAMQESNRWEIFNPASEYFKEAEFIFHEDLSGWRKALVVIASIAAALFFVIGALPVFCLAVKALTPEDKDAVKRLDDGRLPDNLTLLRQVYLAKQQDRFAIPNSWRTGPGRKERMQTLAAFQEKPIVQSNALRDKLKVYFMGNPSEEDQKMLPIVCDYLQTLHGIKVVFKRCLDLEEYNSRVNDGKKQYSLGYQMGKLNAMPHDKRYLMGITNQDIYPEGWNFVYGVGSAAHACGVFSLNRLSDFGFNTALRRLMKLASHEFGHMRGIDHCTRFICNMQGTNNITEFDEEPLTFCGLDMAKICSLNHWSLKEGYERHLHFFENFQEKYGIDINFTKEIFHLKRKIAALS